MVNARSIIVGTLYAGAGIGLGYVFDSYMSKLVQGNMAYLNDFSKTLGNLGQIVGTVGGLGAGLYEAFFSPRAQNPPNNPPGPGNPNIPNAGPRINVNIRGGRNNFRL